MKNKKQKILSSAEIFKSEFDKLEKVFISKDAKKVEAARAELEKKYEQYKKEYEPWSEKTKEFNEQATKYFEEDKEVLERRSSNPYIKEFKSVFKALHLVALIMLTFQIIIVIVDFFTRGWTHFSNGPLLFFWFSFFGREMLEFYVDTPIIFNRKHKWPKNFDVKKSTNAYKLYDAYSSASTVAYLIECYAAYNQLLSALVNTLDEYPDANKAINLKFKELKDKGEF